MVATGPATAGPTLGPRRRQEANAGRGAGARARLRKPKENAQIPPGKGGCAPVGVKRVNRPTPAANARRGGARG
eukprot:11216127-Lingulodinium_polyedra.AAC.1